MQKPFPEPAPPASQTAHGTAAVPTPPLQFLAPRQEDLFNAAFADDAQDLQRASEYAADIFEHLLAEEAARMPRHGYMEGQAEINAKMRAILVDWLIEVHMKYNFRPETLHLAVDIVDRYLAVRPVRRRELQLVGVVAMFIASKYEEIDPPKAKTFAFITDNTYTKAEVLNTECVMLAALDFKVTVPTAAQFLDRLERANGCDGAHRDVVRYVVDLALVDYRMTRYAPSVLVSAALLLSNELLGRPVPWAPVMTHHSRRGEAELRPCAEELLALVRQAPHAALQAVHKKYQAECYHSVANTLTSF